MNNKISQSHLGLIVAPASTVVVPTPRLLSALLTRHKLSHELLHIYLSSLQTSDTLMVLFRLRLMA